MAGGRYSKIHRRMWNDAKFRQLSKPQPCAQVLWIRVLCGPEQGPIPGLFPAREPGLADSMGWTLEGFRKSFQELSQLGMVEADWIAGLVWVKNAVRFNEPANPNVVKGWADTWAELPECSLKNKAFSVLCAYLQGRGESFLKEFVNHCPNHSANHCPNQEQEQEQEQEQDPDLMPPAAASVSPSQGTLFASGSGEEQPACQGGPKDAEKIRAVFAHYRKYHARSFPSPGQTSKEWRQIQARLREDYSVGDLCEAIDGYHRSAWHQGENKDGKKYLGLDLIMRDGTHVATGIAFAEEPAGPVMSERERRSQRAGEGFLARLESLGLGGAGNGPG
jgi:hypothetical protein